MQQEATEKLIGRETHHLLPVLVSVVLIAECDLVLFQPQQSI